MWKVVKKVAIGRGRPKKITNIVLRKLEEGFCKGLSDREACVYADVALSTFYDFCKENSDFSERKEALKDSPKMHAKINIATKIESGDIELSKYYLERKCADEFSTKQSLQVDGHMSSNMTFEPLQIYLPSNGRDGEDEESGN